MSQTERLYKIAAHLKAGRCVTPAALTQEFEISPATLKRDIAHLRDRMNMPIEFARDLRGYRLDPKAQQIGTQYELPGLWLAADEVHALSHLKVFLNGKQSTLPMHGTAELGKGLEAAIKRQLGLK